jgi:chemotaxis protein MotB
MPALRRGTRYESPIWPGFVDAMTSLLLVLMFVLTVFILIQSVLRETIDTQGGQLDSLSAQVADLADALGLERQKVTGLEGEVDRLGSDLADARARGEDQLAVIATLSGQLSARQADLAAAAERITAFEAEVASLLIARDAARGEAQTLTAQVSDLEAAQAKALTDREALELALAETRDEVDAQAEAARLDAARREALEALVAGLRTETAQRQTSLAEALARLDAAEAETAALEGRLGDAEAARAAEATAAEALRTRLAGVEAELTEAERLRLADLAAAEALRARLQSADAELTAMTLALEARRKEAEETLTLLAAERTAAADLGRKLTEAERQAALVAVAEAELAKETEASAEAERRVALLNEQVAQLSQQLGVLEALLDASAERESAAQVQIETLGNRLNAALAQTASEQRRRAELEEAERIRLEAEAKALAEEAKQLEQYRSEFFGRLREVLADRPGVRIVGDRFVFSSEVLFEPGSADLAPEGQAQIAGVVATLSEVAAEIPPEIDWIIRVDGHTDNVPLSGTGQFADNWALSQGRALSVVRYMQDVLGFPPNRMAATGFGEYQPVALGDSPEARAQNRRIELKLTER